MKGVAMMKVYSAGCFSPIWKFWLVVEFHPLNPMGPKFSSPVSSDNRAEVWLRHVTRLTMP